MIKVSDIVRTLLDADETALEAMRIGVLNLSAFAQRIHPQVEKQTKKPVKVGTIVVALSRISESAQDQPSLKPEVKIADMHIKTGLVELSFEKNSQLISKLDGYKGNSKDFYTMTEGIAEVTLICATTYAEKIRNTCQEFLISEIDDLAAVTLRFGDDYVYTPNYIYSILSILASRKVNLLEIVSTYTELSIIVSQDSVDQVVKALMPYC